MQDLPRYSYFCYPFIHELYICHAKTCFKMGFPRKSDEICIPCCARVCKFLCKMVSMVIIHVPRFRVFSENFKCLILNLGMCLIAILTNFWNLHTPVQRPYQTRKKGHLFAWHGLYLMYFILSLHIFHFKLFYKYDGVSSPVSNLYIVSGIVFIEILK